MLLVIDNYDSFTFNLVQYLGEMGVEMQVHRNDKIEVTTIHPTRRKETCCDQKLKSILNPTQ